MTEPENPAKTQDFKGIRPGELPPKADLKSYGFQIATNAKNELVWTRILVTLHGKEVEESHMTDFELLDILEARALSVLNRVVEHRRKLTDNFRKATEPSPPQ